uniref:Laminin G domain-containing protein n=1 Tax=Aquila chrysaetos chrysaetos TaxID=223781 RepID=A0A663EFK3_AQUCH
MAIENEPTSFTGCIREIVINNRELKLTYCDSKIKFFIAKFIGNSYIKYTDPYYGKRDLQYSRISLNFTTNQTEGLIVWMGKGEDEDNDFLAIGLANGTLKVVINLGERISVPLIHSKYSTCCDERWHFVTVVQNQTCIKVYLDEELILFEDIDPHRKYTALNYGGICYFGGFEIDNLPVSPKLLHFIRMQSFSSYNFVILQSSIRTEIEAGRKGVLGAKGACLL